MHLAANPPRSFPGQTEKNSVGANLFRQAPLDAEVISAIVRAAFQIKEATNCGGLLGQAASKGSRPNSIPSRVLQIGIEIRSATKNNQTYPSSGTLIWGNVMSGTIFRLADLRTVPWVPVAQADRLNGLSGVARCAGAVFLSSLETRPDRGWPGLLQEPE